MATLLKSLGLFVLGLLLVVSTNLPGLSKAIASSSNQVCPIASTNEAPVLTRAQALDAEGHRKFTQGQPYEALTCWQAANQLYQETNSTDELAINHLNQAQALQALGYYNQAEKLLLKLKESPSNTQNPQSFKTRVLRSYGDVLRALGKLEESEKELQAIVNSENQQDRAEALISLGNTQRALSSQKQDLYIRVQGYKNPKDEKSKDYLELAWNSAKEAVGSYQKASEQTTSPIVQLQAQLNQLNFIIQFEQWLLKTKKKAEAEQWWSEVLSQDNLAQLQLKAEDWWLKIPIQIERLPQIQIQLEALTLSHAAIYAKVNFANSLSCLRQSFSTLASDSKAECSVVPFTANSQTLKDPSWQKIDQLLDIAVKDAKNLKDKQAEAYALGHRGRLNAQNQQWNEARTQTQRAAVLASQSREIAYQWEWQLGRILVAQGDIRGAIKVYEEAAQTLKLLRNDLTGTNTDLQFSLRDNIEPVYRELVSLLLPVEEPKPDQKALKKALYYIESLQVAELENFLKCNLSTTTSFTSLRRSNQGGNPIEELFKQVKKIDKYDQKAALLFPVILEKQIAVILKLPGQDNLLYARTPIEEILAKGKLNQLRFELRKKNPDQQLDDLLKELYGWLIQPFENEKKLTGLSTLVFVLDGSLRDIPMAALNTGSQDKPYLVQQDYATVLLPTIQLLRDKTFGGNRLNVLFGGATEKPSYDSGFDELPSVKDQASKVKELLNDYEILLNKDFSRKTFEEKLKNKFYSIIHLATHGNFSSEKDETFILASDARIYINDLESWLRSGSQGRHNSTDLLILSACETAQGDNRATLGIAGLAIKSGASSTVASLWKADRDSITGLTNYFYEELVNKNTRQQKTGISKAEALHRAQQRLLEVGFSDPYHWASLVMVGDWR